MLTRMSVAARRAAALVSGAALVGGVVAVSGAPAATAASASSTSALAASRPGFAATSRDLGPTSPSASVDFEVLLSLPDQAAVQREIEAVSTPGQAAFRHFLTPAQFRDEYSPSAAAVDQVIAWIKGAGLSVASVASSRLYVEATGTMAQAEHLVGTRLDDYSYEGKVLPEPVGDYRIPAKLAGVVAGIVDLDGSSELVHPADTLPGPPPGARYGVQPCSAYYGQKMATTVPPAYGKQWPYTICGYDAQQYEEAFGLSGPIASGDNGHGVTVAITDAYAAPTILSDADTWSAQNGLPQFAPGQFTQDLPAPDGYNKESICGPQGWYGEETLDVEAVHAMAPGANILYVGGANCGGGLNRAWASVIDGHLASVMTDSWSYNGENEPSGTIDFFNEFLEEADTTGITVQFSSGDSGDNARPNGTGKSVNFPASSPWATGVGGTSTEIGKNGQIVFQTGWSNDYAELTNGAWQPAPPGTYSSGSGGGTSVLFAQPFFQKGVVPKSISEYYGSTPMRAVPDVAMPGDPNTGLRVGETQAFPSGTFYSTYRIGGTSLSSPLFAGVVADTISYNNGPIGFINPLLYRDVDTSAITDVLATRSPQATVRTNYANDLSKSQGYLTLLQTIGVPTKIFTGRGYDDMTGVGTPNGIYFLQAMKY